MVTDAANNRKIIGVIGGNVCTAEEFRIGETVGRLIAEAESTLLCGGLGGVMEAACKGASEAGGITVGILPGSQTDSANPYVKIPIATGMGIGRNIVIVRTADALIAIDGRHGTLSEIAFALQLKKPVVAVHPWVKTPGLKVVDSAAEAVTFALDSI